MTLRPNDPMTPITLPGMKNAKKVVERLLSSDSPVQSVLFYGIEGAGHEELARHLAEGWLCSGETKPCGECQACGAFERERNPDFLLIEPLGASSIIRLAAIRRDKLNPIEPPLQEFFRTPPLLSKTKVALITDADRMNADAANALLKTLEEPHPYARMILTTSHVGHLLPTILSRCLAMACALPDEGEFEAEPLIKTLSLGAPGRALQLGQNEEIYQKIADFATKLEKYAPAQALIASQELRDFRMNWRKRSTAEPANRRWRSSRP
jgi:DNA polymerase-3 subunit delta'